MDSLEPMDRSLAVEPVAAVRRPLVEPDAVDADAAAFRVPVEAASRRTQCPKT